jgi:hypothetical protein
MSNRQSRDLNQYSMFVRCIVDNSQRIAGFAPSDPDLRPNLLDPRFVRRPCFGQTTVTTGQTQRRPIYSVASFRGVRHVATSFEKVDFQFQAIVFDSKKLRGDGVEISRGSDLEFFGREREPGNLVRCIMGGIRNLIPP